MTSTGVYVFAIRSFDANNVVTVIDSIQITDFANIRDFYKFTVPTDSVSIKVGGRANEGNSISFTITDLDCIKRIGNSQSARVVYFKDAAVPEFEYVADSLKVTLPAKLMYIFNNDGTELTFDVSTLVSREFTVITTKKLVYDLDNNTISLENYSKSGNYYVLLFVGGNVQSGGTVEGGLLGYYITWLRNYNENKAIQIAKSQISTVPYFASMAVPEFEYTQSAGIKVTLPAKTMYLFTNDGTEASINLADLENREFSVANAQKLVYDFDDGSISVKNYSKVGNFYVLLFVGGRPSEYGYVGGGFAGYYNAWIKNTLQNQINRSLDSVSTGNIKKWSDFEFVFFSDVHAGWTNVQHIVDYAEAENVDCIINGGDIVLARIESGVSDYDTIVSGSSIPVLAVAGNHDCWTGSNWNWADQKDIYNLVTAKVASTVPSIVQPTDAETNGLNYYYKDFGNIRVICLLAMQHNNNNLYFDSAQLSWFSDVLEDARTTLHYYKATATGIEDYTLQSGESPLKIYSNLAEMNTDNTVVANGIYAVRMSVIIVTHAPFDVDEWDEVSEKTNSYVKDDMRTHGIAYDGLKVNDSAVTAVADYITNGGSFICWLTGHRHVDHLITNTNRDGQLMINITSAKYNLHNFDSVTIEDENNPNYDAFDHIGIDLGTGMIKVLRIGLAQDSSMRTRRSWSYDYVNNVLMSEN